MILEDSLGTGRLYDFKVTLKPRFEASLGVYSSYASGVHFYDVSSDVPTVVANDARIDISNDFLVSSTLL